MKHLFTTLAAALFLTGSAWAEQATIYGTLTRTAPGDGLNAPTGQDYIVKTKYPVTVEMESYEQDREGEPPVIVQVVTSEIQIIALVGNPREGETEAEYVRRGDEIDHLLESLIGKKVRVVGDTWAPQNWNHRTPVLLNVDPDKGGSIREATAQQAPEESNERGTAISTLVKLPPKQSDQLTNWAVNHASAQDADPFYRQMANGSFSFAHCPTKQFPRVLMNLRQRNFGKSVRMGKTQPYWFAPKRATKWN